MPSLRIDIRSHVSGIPDDDRAVQAAVDEAVRCVPTRRDFPADTGRLARSARRSGSGRGSRLYFSPTYASYNKRPILRSVRMCAGRIRRAAQRRSQPSVRPLRRLVPFSREVARRTATSPVPRAYTANYERYVARVARETGLPKYRVREMIRDRVIPPPPAAPPVSAAERRIRRRSL